MENPTQTSWSPVFFDHIQTIGPGIAAMDDDRQSCLLRKGHLVAEDAVLRGGWRVIVVVDETNLAPGDDFGRLRQAGQLIRVLLGYFLRFGGSTSGRGGSTVML